MRIDQIRPIVPTLPSGGRTIRCPRCERSVVRGFAHACQPVLQNARDARRAYVLGTIRVR